MFVNRYMWTAGDKKKTAYCLSKRLKIIYEQKKDTAQKGFTTSTNLLYVGVGQMSLFFEVL